MAKRILLLAALIADIWFLGVSSAVMADDILACVKKRGGQLRIVNSHSECRSWEFPITLAGGQDVKLDCFTAELRYLVSGDTPNYCNDPFSFTITNPSPTETQPDQIFDVFCQSPPPGPPFGGDPVAWGLVCKEGWMNTGCTGTTASGFDLDIVQMLNGCFSDDEEYTRVSIFATCCKVTATPR
jgi:hypothetical protein